ncbi:hypothetical protein HHK36_006285 [Tetracentron sinense]|uniref:ACT domain-containing protein ACR n=1 Tax=Tetracentron sinense TaxID=13715 RepID=A0A834ZGZ2_TETSI|nr:hypothetical protein HHK36_006285 [Tetracentron sinense]
MSRHAPLYGAGLEALSMKELDTLTRIHEEGLRQIHALQQRKGSAGGSPLMSPCGLYPTTPPPIVVGRPPSIVPNGVGTHGNGHMNGAVGPCMKEVCWPYFDPDFENLSERLYGPSCQVSIDNQSFEECTVVDSVNKKDLLLEVVQVLTDMNLSISKSYISSDAGWFMDVFHVKDEHGNKLTDQTVINYIQQAIGAKREPKNSGSGDVKNSMGNVTLAETLNKHTAIEMTGTDRPGLFSEISAALADLRCNVVEAHAWSHNEHLACVAYISDQSTATGIDDPRRLAAIEDHLTTVLRATTSIDSSGAQNEQREVKKAGLPGGGDAMTTNAERRLHQLMLGVRDFDGPSGPMRSSWSATDGEEEGKKAAVWIESCNEKGYSIVSVECNDRPRLMFDTVCTLTDMQYVIFHASTGSHGGCAFQEYYIRHMDGCTLNTERERQQVVKCLEAAIERRVCEGIRLELSAHSRIGLLSDITRVLRENGLAVVRADVATQGKNAVNTFYVRDISGNEVDMKMVESLKREMDPIVLEVKNEPSQWRSSPERSCFSIGDMLKSLINQLYHNFIPIK